MSSTGDVPNNIALSNAQGIRRNAGDSAFEAFPTPVLTGQASQYYGGDGDFHDIPTVLSAFLNDTASDITGYKTLTIAVPTAGEANSSASITGAATLVKAFSLTANVFDFISTQILHVHFHAERTAGTKTLTAFARVYHRTSGGTETLIGTSEVTGSITSKADFNVDVPVSDTVFSATDRFIVKLLGNPSGGGSDPTLVIYYQGTTASRVEIGTTPIASGGGHVVQDEGTPLAQRANLNFVGAGVTATDDAGNDATVVTIPGGAGIGGSSGSTNNAIIRADGTGGATVQSSLAAIDDSGGVNIPTGQTYNINGSPHAHTGFVSETLTDGYILVGNASNVAAGVAMSNDATISNTGAVTLKNTGPGATGPIGDGTNVAAVTIDAQGRVTALSAVAITAASGVTRSGATTDGHLAVWNGSSADSIKDGGAVPTGSGADIFGFGTLTPPPTLTNWTAANVSTYFSAVDSNSTIKFKCSLESGDRVRGYYRNYPATPKVTAAFIVGGYDSVYNQVGFIVTDTTKYKIFGTDMIGVPHWTYFDTWNHWVGEGSNANLRGYVGPLLWMQYEEDGSNRYFRMSPNGYDWITYLSETKTTSLTGTKIGVGAYVATAGVNSSPGIIGTLVHWVEA